MHIIRTRRRQKIVFFFIAFLFVILTLRLAALQIVLHKKYVQKALHQHTMLLKIRPMRGTIFDVKRRVLALDTSINSVYAVSRSIDDKEAVAVKLQKILNLPRPYLMDRLNRDKAFVWIKRKISDTEQTALFKANISGIGLLPETKRSYPNSKLLCQVIGFTDMDNHGLEGLESTYDEVLKGRDGYKHILKDARQTYISFDGEDLPAKNGYNLILTVDEVIQQIVEEAMGDIVRLYHPKGIMIIAMDPYSGRIMAMANYPEFDPNESKMRTASFFRNRSITDSFEPGSVFKIVTASAVLEEGVVKTTDMFDCERGEYHIGKKRILHDYHPYGILCFKDVIVNSSNIGTVKAASRLGKDRMFDYLNKFGMGKKTGIDLKGEENGIVRHKKTWTDSDMTTVPMGQGLSVTPIQLAVAISAIANGGLLMQPYIVRQVADATGNVILEHKPVVKSRVISEKTSRTMKEILREVVERGTGKQAKLDGYTACGKTGTAQKVGGGKHYEEGKFVASFIGFAPAKDPRMTLVVCVDEPKGNHFGGVVAAPAFRTIMQKALKYLEVS
ncbi:MAG: penicillin-binding transpeptidase domain-containing protein [Candidatus Omnitrophica bacterium]|nr:penicillin-binding transpeptidase domain-containing protein [Candidatus Omnitrophota bacterium]